MPAPSRCGAGPFATVGPIAAASAPPDEELVVAAAAGDRAAADALLRRHYGRIWTVCRRLAGNDADAADATQEALLAIVRGLPSFDHRARFSTWAYRVATNACLDELRRRGRRPAPGLPDDDPDREANVVDPAPALADRVTDRLALDDALAQLPVEFRDPVVLRDVAGHDYAEIAALLGIPPGTVRSRIARGRSRLAEMLGNQSAGTERPTSRP